MVSRQDFTSTVEVGDSQRSTLNDHPAVMLPDASFLYFGTFEKVGFDLVITNAEGETFIVEDYFSFIPPPNLMLPNGAGLSPEMVAAKLHLPFEDVMFAGPANSANALEEIGKATLVLGDVRVKRMGADGNIEEVQLKRGDTLYEGDEITTGARSFIKARMLDGTRFHLGKNANAVLTDFVYNEAEKQGNFEAFVQRGGFHYKSGKIGKMFEGLGKNHSTISTPSAMIGIRGSELDGHVDENGNTLIRHTSGELAVMDINGLTETLLTDPGNTSFVTINGANTRFETPTPEQEAIFEVVLPPPDTPEELIDVDQDAPQEEEAPPSEGDQGERPEEEAPPETEQEAGEGETAEVDEEGAEETEEEIEEGTEEESAEEDSTEEAEEEVAEDSGPEETVDEERVEGEGPQEEAPQEDGPPEEGAPEEGAPEEGSAEESPAEEEPGERIAAEGNEEPSSSEEPSANEEPSASEEPSANEEPSASEEPSANEEPVNVDGQGEQEPQTRIAGESTSDSDGGAESSIEAQSSAQPSVGEGEVARQETGTNTDGNQQPGQTEEPGNLAGFDNSVEGPTGVTIRESSFGDANTNIVGTENEVITGSVEPTTAGTGERGEQQVAGNELEILDVPTNEENEPDTRVEDRQNEQEPVQEELTPDNPPIARNDFLEVKEAGAREVTNLLLNNDNDGDIGQEPKLAQVEGTGSQGGRIEFDGSTAVYIPNPERLDALRAEETATETFSYRIVSGDLTDTATLTVRLVGTNFAPIAEDDQDETIEDVPITIDVLANDGDPDGDTLTIVSVDNDGAFGDVIIAGDGKGLIYNPPDGLQAGQVGEDVFTYQVSDGQFTATATITVTVVGRNDPPVINATGEPVEISAGGGAVTIPLNEIFLDSDLGDQLEVVSVDTSNTKGVVTIGSIIYDDNGVFDFLKPGETATDTFGVTARDQFGGEGSGFYTVVINGVNDAPNAQNDSYFAVAGETLAASAANGLLGNDTDPEGDPLTVVVSKTQGPQFGELNILPNGSFEYIPGPDFGGNDSFVYTVSDGELTDTAVVNIVVDLVNDAPITAPDFYTVSADGSVIGNVLDNDVDPEGQQLTAELVTEPSSGTLNLGPGGLFEYTPAVAPDGTVQSDSFVYVAIDPQGRQTVETVTINIVEDNLPPELISPIPDATVPIDATSSIDLNTYFADPEGSNLEFAFTTSAGTASFTLVGSTLSVTPPAAAEGETVTVEIAASDGQNITTDEFILTVGPANQAPVVDNPVGNQSVNAFVFLNENINGVFSDPDPDDVLTFSLNTNAPFLGLSGTFLQGSPSAADVGTYTVQLTATDPAGATATETFTLTVSAPPPNNPSVPVSGDQVTVTDSLTMTLTLTSTFIASDTEGLPATGIYAINTQGGLGTASIDADSGNITYTRPAATFGFETFTVDVTDATGAVTTLPITVLVRPTDTPGSIIGGLTETTTENVAATNTLSLSDSDGLAAMNPYIVSTPPANGTASIDAGGNWVYTPNANYTGPDSFVVTAFDGFNYSTTQTVNLTVNPLPAPNNPASHGVLISGSTEFGNILTASPASIVDVDGTSGALYFYEWFVDGVSQGTPSTASSTYTTTISDVGKSVSVEITFTDDLGFGETVSDGVVITPQDPNVSGTQGYTLIPGFIDFVNGSTGNDNITLTNAAENNSGTPDFVDLGDGTDTLTLDNVINDIEIEGVENLVGGTLTDTVTIFDDLNSLLGILPSRSNNDVIKIEGFVTLTNEAVTFGGIGGDFVVNPGANLTIGGSTGSLLNLQGFSANDGTVILDGTGTSTLTVASGSFSHHTQFISQGIPGTAHQFQGGFDNNGSLIIDKSLTFLTGSYLDLTPGGVLFINNGQALTFDNSTFYVDGSSQINGTNSESILIHNNSVLDTGGSYQHFDYYPQLDFDGTALIDGNFVLGPNVFLTLTGDSANALFTNQGNLQVKTPGPTTINQLFNDGNGFLQLTSDATDTSSVLTVTTNVTNNGTIELDNADNTINLVSTLNVGGTLTNLGTIHARDDDESLTAGRHTINGRVVDNGEIIVHAELELSGASADHDFSGKIELRENSGNGYGGDLYISSANTVDFLPGSKLFGQGGITSNVGITHMGGEIEPDDLGAAGTITFNSGLDLSPSSVVLLDIFNGTGTNQDLIVVNGLLDVEGTIQLTFHDTSLILGGTTIQDVISFSSIANATFDNVVHNLGSGFNVSLVSDGSNLDVVITQGFENFADNGNAPFDWSVGGAWNGGLPTNTQDVLIDNHDVDFTGGAADVQSLTVVNSTLDVTGGTLDLNNDSLIDGGSIINLTGPGVLFVDGRLIVDGQFNLNSGTVTTTNTVTSLIDVLGMGTINASGSPVVEVLIHNQGTLSLIGSGTLMGNQPIENSNFFSVNPGGNVNLDVPIENQDGGLIDVGSTATTVMITHSQNVDNFDNAVYRLDTPGTSGESTNVELNNATFTNQGFLQVLDTGASGGSRFFDLNGFTFNNAQGNLDIQADVTFDVEGGLFDQQDGEIYVATSINLNIDGGAGGDIHVNSGSNFAGDGNINFVNNVTLTLMGDLFLNSNNYFDTSGGDVTFTGPHTLFVDGGTTLSLHNNDAITTSALDNNGNLSLQGNNITIGALLSNFGNLNVIGDSGGGLKTITSGFSNDGSVTLDIAAGETNTLSVGGQLINSFSGFLYSNDGGGATNPNILQADLQNFGTVDVNHDLTLDASGAGSHDNFASLHIAPGATLTIGVNDSFENFYDDSGSAFGSITGGGILDVSGTGVTFVNDGLLMPGGFSATDIFTIQTNANTQFGHGSVVEIDLNFNTPGTGHDQLVFSGTAPDLNGRLRLNPLISPSGSYTIITATSFGGLFSMIEGTDLYAMGGDVFDVTVSATDITVTAVTPDLTGTPGDDGSLDATGATVIHADDGNDVISNVSAGDTVFGGEGDDVIIGDTSLKRVHGGDGIDTLTLTNGTLNFMGIDGYRIESIEVLGLEGNGAQTVTLDAMSIRNIVDEENDLTFSEGSLVVYGDSSDHLILIGDYNPVGNDFFDIRSAGNFEEYLRLEQNSTSTGTTSVYIDNQISAEVIRLDGSKDIYGSAGDDDISSGGDIVATANDDVIDGRDGNDFIDGLGGDDSLFGGHGNDTIVRDIADTGIIDGGDGFDTLLDDSPGATINLNGVTNLQNFERVDMADGDGNDVLSIDLAGLGNIIGDNSLESLLPDGQLKFIVDGDAGDQFNLSGIGVHSTSIAALGAAGWVTNGAELDYLGTGTNYLKLTNGAIDIYVHEDVANVI